MLNSVTCDHGNRLVRSSSMDYVLSTIRETPLNVLLWIPVGYLAYDILFPRSSLPTGSTVPASYEEGYVWKPKNHPPVVLFKKYSPITLAEFDGVKSPTILLAINRVVYDVTSGKSFYGPGKRFPQTRTCVRPLIIKAQMDHTGTSLGEMHLGGWQSNLSIWVSNLILTDAQR